jgi:hypothetical protein
MQTLSDYFLSFNYFLHVFTILLLIGSVFAFLVGVGVLLQSHVVFRLIDFSNQYVSTRQAIKPAEIQRNVEPFLYGQRKLLGSLVILGAIVALFLLLSSTIENRMLLLVAGNVVTLSDVWLASSIKWILVVGNVSCLLVGLLLYFQPAKLAQIEVVVNRWYSVRKHTSVLEKMYLGVDNWVIKHPTISGSFIVFLSLNVAVVMFTHL